MRLYANQSWQRDRLGTRADTSSASGLVALDGRYRLWFGYASLGGWVVTASETDAPITFVCRIFLNSFANQKAKSHGDQKNFPQTFRLFFWLTQSRRFSRARSSCSPFQDYLITGLFENFYWGTMKLRDTLLISFICCNYFKKRLK